ncbi:MAG: cytidine deaminase [Clostridia bacterium]
MTNEELYDIASNARKNAYSPYSHVCVGAAILTKKGSVYTGVNVENASFGATICAERSAAVQAVGNGETEFEKIAISISGTDSLPSPCGICRQFLSEFSKELVVIYQKNGCLTARKLSALLPDSFAL